MRIRRQTPPPAGTTEVPFYALDEVGLAVSDVLAVTVGRQLAGVAGGWIPANAPGSPATTFLGDVVDPQAFQGGPPSAVQRDGVLVEDNAGIPATASPVGIPNTLQDLIGSMP